MREHMKMELFPRKGGVKSELAKARREGFIPVIVYGAGLSDSKPMMVRLGEFDSCLREVKKGALSTVRFDSELDGKKVQLIVKDIAYAKTTYAVLHIDLQLVDKDKPVEVFVPIFSENEDRCVGITQGGMIKRIKRCVRVRAKPAQIPSEFVIDMTNMSLGQRFTVSELQIPEGVEMREEAKQVLLPIG